MQVYLGDELVGALEMADIPPRDRMPAEISVLMHFRGSQSASGGSFREIPPALGNSFRDQYEMKDMIWIPVVERHSVVKEATLKDLGFTASKTILAKHAGIPSYAEITRNIENLSIRATWHVLSPNIDQYETLFDCPDYVPL